jgi:hypothetical protein
MRRNIVRYAMLSYVITLQKVSFRVKKRFPTWQHMVDAGEYNSAFGVSTLNANLQALMFCCFDISQVRRDIFVKLDTA